MHPSVHPAFASFYPLRPAEARGTPSSPFATRPSSLCPSSPPHQRRPRTLIRADNAPVESDIDTTSSPPTPSARSRPSPSATPPSPPPATPPEPEPTPSQVSALTIAAVGTVAALGAATLSGKLAAFPLFPDALDMPTSGSDVLTLWNDFVAGPHFAVSLGMGVSALIQALTGFGFAIVSVGALTQVPWIAHSSVFNAVQPVAASLGALTGWALLLPELDKINWRAISVLLVASSITTPLGAVLLDYFEASTMIRLLGALITGYVLYSFSGTKVPKKLGGSAGAWFLGFVAGTFGGAFDITGPPLVVHGEAAEWEGTNGDFRRNVLTVVSVNSTLVVLWDLFAGRLNDFYYTDFMIWAAPTTAMGVILGKWLAGRMEASMFKKVVLGTCLVMGVKLLFS